MDFALQQKKLTRSRGSFEINSLKRSRTPDGSHLNNFNQFGIEQITMKSLLKPNYNKMKLDLPKNIHDTLNLLRPKTLSYGTDNYEIYSKKDLEFLLKILVNSYNNTKNKITIIRPKSAGFTDILNNKITKKSKLKSVKQVRKELKKNELNNNNVTIYDHNPMRSRKSKNKETNTIDTSVSLNKINSKRQISKNDRNSLGNLKITFNTFQRERSKSDVTEQLQQSIRSRSKSPSKKNILDNEEKLSKLGLNKHFKPNKTRKSEKKEYSDSSDDTIDSPHSIYSKLDGYDEFIQAKEAVKKKDWGNALNLFKISVKSMKLSLDELIRELNASQLKVCREFIQTAKTEYEKYRRRYSTYLMTPHKNYTRTTTKPKKRRSRSTVRDRKKHNKTSDSESKQHKRSKSTNPTENKEPESPKTPQSKGDKQLKGIQQRISNDIIVESPNIKFKDVQGLINVKLTIYESIILPIEKPLIFNGPLRKPSSGLLLFGPPGNGKTMIAKCIASECNSTFFSISASTVTSKWVGEAEKVVRALFEMARNKAPSIIFIDEIDSLLTKRGSKSEAESSRRIKTEFLIQFDGLKNTNSSDNKNSIFVIGATNLPWEIDEAVLRRFSRRILVPLPDKHARKGIIHNILKNGEVKVNLSSNNINTIVDRTNNYSCSDLAKLCQDSAMAPVRELIVQNKISNANNNDIPEISFKHFEIGLHNVKSSVSVETLSQFDEWNSKFGCDAKLNLETLPEHMRHNTIDENSLQNFDIQNKIQNN